MYQSLTRINNFGFGKLISPIGIYIIYKLRKPPQILFLIY